MSSSRAGPGYCVIVRFLTHADAAQSYACDYVPSIIMSGAIDPPRVKRAKCYSSLLGMTAPDPDRS